MPVKKDNQTRGDELVDYLRKNVQKGYSIESLKWALVKQGNSRAEVDKAIAVVEKEKARLAVKQQPRQEITLEQSAPAAVQVEPEDKPFWKKMFGI